ncbi:MAG: hypothetical protein Q4G61_04825 [Tissierellia bacterium]|nr:hypothetical protein [Tissierellia bacterium]
MNESLPEFWSFSRNRDASEICSKLITWKGPYSWPGYEEINRCDPIPNLSGVYLLTFEHEDGFLLRSIGITNSIKTRFRKHTLEYNRGKYTILDMNFVTKGLRKELWHGWGFAEKNRDLFLKHQEEIWKYTQKELGSYRVFLENPKTKGYVNG